jgi:CotH kinase protein/RTX calcium-binding nonapeptide repeat (4 copies)
VSERGTGVFATYFVGAGAARWPSLWLCFLSVLFLGLLSPASASAAVTGEPPADDPAAWLFSPDAVVEIDLALPQESIDALNSDPGEYQDGTFSLTTPSEVYGPFNVGIRLKGTGSFRPLSGKAAFKVKMSHSVPGQRFLGLKTLTLNNMIQDPSMIHEVLAYEVFRSAGVAASRTGYAYVRVNDQDYGVYLNIETLDDVMLPRWFESTQHLYEGELDEQGGVDVLPGNAGRFSVDEGSETDLSDLEALIAAVNGGGDFSDRVQSVADLQQLSRMWAVEKYIGHWDSYSGQQDSSRPNNYNLHSDSAGIFRMLPWGTDQTWARRLAFDGEGGVMFNECLDDASCFALYVDAVGEVRSLVVGLGLDSLAASTAALLAPWQEQDPRREDSLEEIQTAVAATRDFLAVRHCDAEAWLFGSGSGCVVSGGVTAPPITPAAPPITPGTPLIVPAPSEPPGVTGSSGACKGKTPTIVGTNGNDVRKGTPARDVIVGLAGNDTLSGLAGNDLICGGPGKDALKGGKGKDTLLGQKGKDKLKGGGGKDLCKGGKGKDTASKCEVEKSI